MNSESWELNIRITCPGSEEIGQDSVFLLSLPRYSTFLNQMITTTLFTKRWKRKATDGSTVQYGSDKKNRTNSTEQQPSRLTVNEVKYYLKSIESSIAQLIYKKKKSRQEWSRTVDIKVDVFLIKEKGNLA